MASTGTCRHHKILLYVPQSAILGHLVPINHGKTGMYSYSCRKYIYENPVISRGFVDYMKGLTLIFTLNIDARKILG